MEAWMAFVSIIAIVAIVLVAGGLIAFIGHMIIGAFDKDRQEVQKGEVVNYVDYKQLENAKPQQKVEDNEYDFDAINEAKAEQEKQMLAEDKDVDVFKLEALELNGEEDLDALEARLKAENEKAEETVESDAETVEQVETAEAEEVVAETETTEEVEDEDIDLDSLLDEISNDVIE